MTPEIETHHEVHRTGHKWVDWVVTGTALLVSLISLSVAIHHGHTMQRLVEANSQPFLQFTYSDAERRTDGGFDLVMRWEVENVGAGPARIEWFQAAVASNLVKSWRQTLEALHEQAIQSGQLATRVDIGTIITSDLAPYFLKAGNKVELLRWQRTEANAAFWNIVNDRMAKNGEVELRACYCSIFEQCWNASRSVFKPRSIERCPQRK